MPLPYGVMSYIKVRNFGPLFFLPYCNMCMVSFFRSICVLILQIGIFKCEKTEEPKMPKCVLYMAKSHLLGLS